MQAFGNFFGVMVFAEKINDNGLDKYCSNGIRWRGCRGHRGGVRGNTAPNYQIVIC